MNDKYVCCGIELDKTTIIFHAQQKKKNKKQSVIHHQHLMIRSLYYEMRIVLSTKQFLAFLNENDADFSKTTARKEKLHHDTCCHEKHGNDAIRLKKKLAFYYQWFYK